MSISTSAYHLYKTRYPPLDGKIHGNDGVGELQRQFTHLEISVPGYHVVKSLKTGGMSEAILVVKKHGKDYIAKRVSSRDNSRSMAELNTLRRIPQGQNLNYMVDHFWGPARTHLTFILEYCDGGTLYDKIQRRRASGRRISETFLWHAMLGIANALAFLH